jgi:hypothetical protein
MSTIVHERTEKPPPSRIQAVAPNVLRSDLRASLRLRTTVKRSFSRPFSAKVASDVNAAQAAAQLADLSGRQMPRRHRFRFAK